MQRTCGYYAIVVFLVLKNDLLSGMQLVAGVPLDIPGSIPFPILSVKLRVCLRYGRACVT